MTVVTFLASSRLRKWMAPRALGDSAQDTGVE